MFRKFFLVFLALLLTVVLSIAVYVYAHLDEIVSEQATSYLQAHGLSRVEINGLRYENQIVSARHVTLHGLIGGEDVRVEIDNVEVWFDWERLLDGELDRLSAEQVVVVFSSVKPGNVQPKAQEPADVMVVSELLPSSVRTLIPVDQIKIDYWAVRYPLGSQRLEISGDLSVDGPDIIGSAHCDFGSLDHQLHVSVSDLAPLHIKYRAGLRAATIRATTIRATTRGSPLSSERGGSKRGGIVDNGAQAAHKRDVVLSESEVVAVDVNVNRFTRQDERLFVDTSATFHYESMMELLGLWSGDSSGLPKQWWLQLGPIFEKIDDVSLKGGSELSLTLAVPQVLSKAQAHVEFIKHIDLSGKLDNDFAVGLVSEGLYSLWRSSHRVAWRDGQVLIEFEPESMADFFWVDSDSGRPPPDWMSPSNFAVPTSDLGVHIQSKIGAVDLKFNVNEAWVPTDVEIHVDQFELMVNNKLHTLALGGRATNATSKDTMRWEGSSQLTSLLTLKDVPAVLPELATTIHLSYDNDTLKTKFNGDVSDLGVEFYGSGSYGVLSQGGEFISTLDIGNLELTYPHILSLLKDSKSPLFSREMQNLSFISGRINVSVVTSLTGGGPSEWSNVFSLSAESITGLYDDMAFDEVNANTTIESQVTNDLFQVKSLQPLQVSVDKVHVGFPITDIALSLHWPTLRTVEQLEVGVDLVKAQLFGGQIYNERAFVLDFINPSNRFELFLKDIELAKLASMQQQDITAQGILDGRLPIEISDAGINITNGKLSAREPGGMIRYSFEGAQEMLISSPELGVALKMLDNFVYKQLQSDVSFDPEGNLHMGIFLSGHNPDEFDGRAVEFNINLDQNVYPLLESLRITDDFIGNIEKQLE